MSPKPTYTFKKPIANHIKKCIEGGVSVKDKQARDGDFKSQELFLRSKAGWSPNSTVNEVEHEGDPDEDSGAIDALMAKLGKSRKSNDEDE